ncbi:SDR family oxidoreductase [Mycetocola tolaasinivorans]|uniref:SDR family oxidoreductase n=1 Tax=Mycetocola tolaasinivorans TaxID=76635 RepID=A0A3L7AA10_9MICO|nr:SDR family oxidoreductase [Mycetocola tolaasinivorans]RLP76471.1 SDR family oxidoreductase [Mycetocola tolaasinivorans]
MVNQHRVVIISGASQGMGSALVAAYRARGFGVVAISRSITPSTDPEIVTIAGDIADPQTAARAVSAALEHFGRIDTVINNAGVFASKPFTDFTAEDYATTVGTNLGGFFHLTQAAMPALIAGGSGHVVSITTTLVEHADARVPAALATLTKGGITAASRGLAIEYADRGVRVNVVSPGIIRTPMHPEEYHATYASMHPLGRMGDIEDIVRGVLYLEDATFATGEILHVDGGQSAGH